VDAFLALEASGWKGRAGTAMGSAADDAFSGTDSGRLPPRPLGAGAPISRAARWLVGVSVSSACHAAQSGPAGTRGTFGRDH